MTLRLWLLATITVAAPAAAADWPQWRRPEPGRQSDWVRNAGHLA